MESPTTPMTLPTSCAFFECYGLDTTQYDAMGVPISPTTPLSPQTPATPTDIHQNICLSKCSSISTILKDNWMDLIFKVTFPNLISQEKLVHNFTLQELTGILSQGDLLPEEREEIKRMRCKARNNKAAKSLRQKYKEQDQTLVEDVTSLIKHKDALKQEREDILREISHFKAMNSS